MAWREAGPGRRGRGHSVLSQDSRLILSNYLNMVTYVWSRYLRSQGPPKEKAAAVGGEEGDEEEVGCLHIVHFYFYCCYS